MRLNGAVVEAADLVLGYGGTIAVDRSTFAIPRGAVTAIIGPNGSGKSTLLNAIAGLNRPRAGTLSVGVPASRIAYVLQTTKVNEALPITVREVVTMGRYAQTGWYRRLDRVDRAAIERAMERTAITGLGGRHLQQLSGGQRQRVFIAQGLAQDHDMVLLDEPMTGIDLPTSQSIDEVIDEERNIGHTVVMTTHDLSQAGIADHVVLLSGRVVASGPPDVVLTAESLTDAYGPSLLHVEDHVFLDDPAHRPVPGRHTHRERTIHTEASPADLHGDEG